MWKVQVTILYQIFLKYYRRQYVKMNFKWNKVEYAFFLVQIWKIFMIRVTYVLFIDSTRRFIVFSCFIRWRVCCCWSVSFICEQSGIRQLISLHCFAWYRCNFIISLHFVQFPFVLCSQLSIWINSFLSCKQLCWGHCCSLHWWTWSNDSIHRWMLSWRFICSWLFDDVSSKSKPHFSIGCSCPILSLHVMHKSNSWMKEKTKHLT